MASGIGMKIVKALFIFCNGLLSLIGLAIFVLALLIRFHNPTRNYASEKFGEYPDQMTGDMVVFIVLGFFMFLVGVIALIGAGLENLLALRLYIAAVVLVGLFQLIYTVVVLCLKDKIRRQVYVDIAVFVINLDLQPDRMRLHFDHMQRSGNCCGCTGVRDYNKLRYFVPESCSGSVGCCPTIWNNMKKLAILIGCLALAVATIEYVAVVFACMLISSIGKSRYHVKAANKKTSSKKDKLSIEMKSYRKIEEG